MLRAGFLWLQRAGATLRCGARASHCGGFSCCGARALGARASVVAARGLSSCGSRALGRRLSSWWHTGLAAPRHVGSSQTRARTRVPCISRWILNHCATREALFHILKAGIYSFISELCYRAKKGLMCPWCRKPN